MFIPILVELNTYLSNGSVENVVAIKKRAIIRLKKIIWSRGLLADKQVTNVAKWNDLIPYMKNTVFQYKKYYYISVQK